MYNYKTFLIVTYKNYLIKSQLGAFIFSIKRSKYMGKICFSYKFDKLLFIGVSFLLALRQGPSSIEIRILPASYLIS